VRAALQAAENVVFCVILSEAKNLSFFVLLQLNRREILRFAQNDRNRGFFRKLLSQWGPDFAVLTHTLQGLKPLIFLSLIVAGEAATHNTTDNTTDNGTHDATHNDFIRDSHYYSSLAKAAQSK
jgi:hypothetical protein